MRILRKIGRESMPYKSRRTAIDTPTWKSQFFKSGLKFESCYTRQPHRKSHSLALLYIYICELVIRMHSSSTKGVGVLARVQDSVV